MTAKPSPIADFKRAISPVAEIIEEAREGRMFILIDEEDRENEGDLVIPAQFATPARLASFSPANSRLTSRCAVGVSWRWARSPTKR